MLMWSADNAGSMNRSAGNDKNVVVAPEMTQIDHENTTNISAGTFSADFDNLEYGTQEPDNLDDSDDLERRIARKSERRSPRKRDWR
jgi:hypothetical protein